MPDCDVIVIGSGPAGAQAALVLVRAGLHVTMLDGGRTEPKILRDAPPLTYAEIRRTSDDQWRWFLGEDLSGIPLESLDGGFGGGMVSGNRRYVTDGTKESLPLVQENIQIIQSLACGGLGAAWGAASAYLDAADLRAMGLDPEEMEQHYDAVTKDIGISGPGSQPHVQPPLRIDQHARHMLARYEKKKSWFEGRHLRLTQPHSAVLTQPLGRRKPEPYRDMDYWADPEHAVYRPQDTIDELQRNSLFTYIAPVVVETVQEGQDTVRVTYKKEGVSAMLNAKRVILAAGAIGTARILLKSRDVHVPIPFLSKPHMFSAMLNLSALGDPGDEERFSLCQLLLIDETKRDELAAGCVQLYSYGSLQLFRLLQGIPLPVPMAMRMAALLAPTLVIADVRFPAFRGASSTLTLKDGQLHARHHIRPEEHAAREASFKRLLRGLKSLGMTHVKTIPLPEGSASHYAGTVPIEGVATQPLSVDQHGKLHGNKRVYVGDAGMFRCLPCLPPTLTIMANARRVAGHVLTELA